ncbi:MAG: aspartate kinase [Oligoflexia bacterium]|nr:aspartate kinase [Oligoflexia bacterium]
MNIMVKKFGGTSVGSVERILNVAKRSLDCQLLGESPVVVVSAMSGDTNRLVALGDQVFPHHRGPAYDMLVASGEQVSVALVSMAIERLGGKARPYLAHQLGIFTDSMHSKARIQKIDTQKILQDIEQGIIPVVAGFQGVDDADNITTLGRGGSDTSAVAIAAALNARACEIFTDVPAVFTADPRLVPKAREIPKLSFEEMIEMAALGSKVLHIRSVEIGAKHGVRIHVRSSFESREGTWVVPEGESMESAVVSSVTHESSTGVITVEPLPKGTEVLAKLFTALASKGIIVDIISQLEIESGQRLSFSVGTDDVVAATGLVREQFGSHVSISTMKDVSKVSIVGVGMRNHPGVAAKFFSTLAQNNVEIHLVTTSEIKVSAVIDRPLLEKAAQSLHSAFGLDQ